MAIEHMLTETQWEILTSAYELAQEEWPMQISEETWRYCHADFATLRDLALMDCVGQYPSNIWGLTDTGAAWVEKRQDALIAARKRTEENLAAWNRAVSRGTNH